MRTIAVFLVDLIARPVGWWLDRSIKLNDLDGEDH